MLDDRSKVSMMSMPSPDISRTSRPDCGRAMAAMRQPKPSIRKTSRPCRSLVHSDVVARPNTPRSENCTLLRRPWWART